MRIPILLKLLLVSVPSYAEITFDSPEGWKVSGSVIYEDERKIGEITSKKIWPYASGAEFIESFKEGFMDDPDSTKFVRSGSEGEVFWVCRSSVFEGANGEYGVWYVRRFWVNGPILTIYSHKSCDHELEAAIKIAGTLFESNT
jgi:hypothetical protein